MQDSRYKLERSVVVLRDTGALGEPRAELTATPSELRRAIARPRRMQETSPDAQDFVRPQIQNDQLTSDDGVLAVVRALDLAPGVAVSALELGVVLLLQAFRTPIIVVEVPRNLVARGGP